MYGKFYVNYFTVILRVEQMNSLKDRKIKVDNW